MVDIVGRDEELRWLEDELAQRSPTIWRSALDRARREGRTVLECRGSEAERRLSFAALGDLVEPLGEEERAALPAPQRRAGGGAAPRGRGRP
jgi:hypothetical protein